MVSSSDKTKTTLYSIITAKPFLFSLLIALSFLTLTYLFFHPHFQYNDDVQVLLLLKGVGLTQAPSALNQRENILLCWLLQGLYTHFPNFPWYSGFLVLTEFIALWATLAAFQLGPYPKFRTFLFLFASFGINVYFFTNLQWTMTASLAALGAFFLSASYWRMENQKPSLLPYLLISYLLTASIQIRYPSFFLIALIALPVLLTLVWKKPLTPARLALLRFWVVAMGISLSSILFNHYYYQRDPGWSKSIAVFDQHFELHETRDPVYNEETKPIFDSIGWTRNDLDLFQNWYFLDETTYGVEKLQKLADYFPKVSLRKPTNYSLEKKITFPTTQIVLYFFLAAFWLIPSRALRPLIATTFWTFLVLTFLMVYEKLPERVFLPALFFLSVLSLFYVTPKWREPALEHQKSSLNLIVSSVLSVCLFLFSFFFLHQEHSRNGRWVQCQDLTEEALRDLHPQDQQLFVLWDSAFPYECVNAFGDYEVFRHFNIVALTWFQRSPTTAAMLERFGVKDLMRDMVDNPNLFVVCTKPEMDAYQIHMRERYQMDVQMEPVFTSLVFSAYRVHSADKN